MKPNGAERWQFIYYFFFFSHDKQIPFQVTLEWFLMSSHLLEDGSVPVLMTPDSQAEARRKDMNLQKGLPEYNGFIISQVPDVC